MASIRTVSPSILITARGGHYFITDNEIHYDVAASQDKDFVVIEGAVHGQTPCEGLLKGDRPILFQRDEESL